jgi:membrane protease YdiL (CAAX protease family)
LDTLSWVFLDPHRHLRNGWWFLAFFGVLAALLAPLLVASQHFGFEVSVAQQAAIILAASWFCQRLRKRPMSELLGTFDSRWLRDLSRGVAGGAALMLVPATLLALSGAVQWRGNPGARSALLAALFLHASVAIAEEALFRGFIFQRLIAGLGPWPAQVLLAAWFLLTHMDNPGMIGTVRWLAGINIFLASILFGLALLRTRSLALPIGLHFAANWVQGGLLGLGVSGSHEPGLLLPRFSGAPVWVTGGDFGLEASVPGLACVIVAVVVCFRWNPAPVVD